MIVGRGSASGALVEAAASEEAAVPARAGIFTSDAQVRTVSYLPFRPVASVTGRLSWPDRNLAKFPMVSLVCTLRARPFIMIIMLLFEGRTGKPSLPMVNFGGAGGVGTGPDPSPSLGAGASTASFHFGPFFPTLSSHICISFFS